MRNFKLPSASVPVGTIIDENQNRISSRMRPFAKSFTNVSVETPTCNPVIFVVTTGCDLISTDIIGRWSFNGNDADNLGYGNATVSQLVDPAYSLYGDLPSLKVVVLKVADQLETGEYVAQTAEQTLQMIDFIKSFSADKKVVLLEQLPTYTQDVLNALDVLADSALLVAATQDGNSLRSAVYTIQPALVVSGIDKYDMICGTNNSFIVDADYKYNLVSEFGSKVNIYAPAINYVATVDVVDGVAQSGLVSGSFLGAAHVAYVAARLWSILPLETTTKQLRDLVLSESTKEIIYCEETINNNVIFNSFVVKENQSSSNHTIVGTGKTASVKVAGLVTAPLLYNIEGKPLSVTIEPAVPFANISTNDAGDYVVNLDAAAVPAPLADQVAYHQYTINATNDVVSVSTPVYMLVTGVDLAGKGLVEVYKAALVSKPESVELYSSFFTSKV